MLYHWYKRAARTGPGLLWSSAKQHDDESTTTTTTPPPPPKNPKGKVRSGSQEEEEKISLVFLLLQAHESMTFPRVSPLPFWGTHIQEVPSLLKKDQEVGTLFFCVCVF
ncbi:uncharacterized protein SEPMUDRAFT_166404 [Sphaerulina musiva SO2202]|uniref:Uncharacterized protein n=1 Tax=Sphaerulina musiva (strain SO2202) TaxID=692275 RepID=M3BRG8_SPHMS|nr:uncharacterized protein SEPMUDRAFT_166404 [Sphaerulina musiva SO2202]EMF08718.1 hypothetical protein SEPMUDRAFT_166404 [Sphaerulina musiva SO2202]